MEERQLNPQNQDYKQQNPNLPNLPSLPKDEPIGYYPSQPYQPYPPQQYPQPYPLPEHPIETTELKVEAINIHMYHEETIKCLNCGEHVRPIHTTRMTFCVFLIGLLFFCLSIIGGIVYWICCLSTDVPTCPKCKGALNGESYCVNC